jgi:hypothetical protein
MCDGCPPDAAEALADWLARPRGAWVWRQFWEATPIEPFEGRLSVDPETAARWLGRRRFDPQKVASFAADMASGSWRDTPSDPIVLRAGALGDGAHRLAAIRQLGRPQALWVRFEG